MVARILSQDEIALGRAVLLATDALGMEAEGAFWLYDKKEKEWLFFLVTSLFERVGPREIYYCLNDALENILSAKEADELRLFIATPKEPLVQQLRKQIKTKAHVSEPHHAEVIIGDGSSEAFIYRLAGELHSDTAKKVQRRFRKSCREVAAAV